VQRITARDAISCQVLDLLDRIALRAKLARAAEGLADQAVRPWRAGLPTKLSTESRQIWKLLFNQQLTGVH
jgi:hypothetical protein